MKYDKVLEKIKSGKMSRADLLKLKINAEEKFRNGDKDAKYILNAINIAKPADSYILFMGFCPDANFNNRLDIEWKEKGICRFDFLEDEKQSNRFNDIYTGDLVVLKKIQNMKEQRMKIFGHGRVKSIAYDEDNVRYFNMNWSSQNEIIEVPLMACVSTVDVRTIEHVQDVMPEEFYMWLGE